MDLCHRWGGVPLLLRESVYVCVYLCVWKGHSPVPPHWGHMATAARSREWYSRPKRPPWKAVDQNSSSALLCLPC